MSGHSKWAKIKRGKEATDAKRGAVFTKLGNAIAVAAKTGGDPDMNPGLALAIQKAKEANMPNSNIERSIKRGTGELGGKAIEEMLYEGYGPAGIAVIVECASDNRKRTYADVRTAFAKNGGNIAETGAVSFQFDRKGVITVAKTGNDDDDQLNIIDAGAEDVTDEDEAWSVYTDQKSLQKTKDKLQNAGFEIEEATLAYVPNTTIKISDEKEKARVIKFMEVLDELDDVVETYSNLDLT